MYQSQESDRIPRPSQREGAFHHAGACVTSSDRASSNGKKQWEHPRSSGSFPLDAASELDESIEAKPLLSKSPTSSHGWRSGGSDRVEADVQEKEENASSETPPKMEDFIMDDYAHRDLVYNAVPLFPRSPHVNRHMFVEDLGYDSDVDAKGSNKEFTPIVHRSEKIGSGGYDGASRTALDKISYASSFSSRSAPFFRHTKYQLLSQQSRGRGQGNAWGWSDSAGSNAENSSESTDENDSSGSAIPSSDHSPSPSRYLADEKLVPLICRPVPRPRRGAMSGRRPTLPFVQNRMESFIQDDSAEGGIRLE